MWQGFSLEGKVALVTGASRGLGQAIALTLGQMGATVIGSATSQKGKEGISHYFEEQGIKGYGIILNVCDPEQIVSAIADIKSQAGAPVSILVNNAGVTHDNLLLRMKDQEWDDTISTNLTGVFRVTKACLRDMVKMQWGRVISVSSVVGSTGNAGQTNYAATNAGVMGFSKSLAKEIASRGITVNVVAPGFIDTDMTRELNEVQRAALLQSIPMGRMGHAKDIADCVAFLASEASRYITGETIHVNGGMYMS
jgi:3-oxoacyl-[acyl-carrier protein] reductase